MGIDDEDDEDHMLFSASEEPRENKRQRCLVSGQWMHKQFEEGSEKLHKTRQKH